MPQPLGQHFLKNKSAINTVLDALALEAGDTVIEIGPGRGALTVPLAERCAQKKCRVVAIEKDNALAEQLRASARNWKMVNGNLEIVTGDILRALPLFISSSQLPITNYLITGNIPYYLTGALLRLISKLEPKPKRCVFMLQREVAERIAARPPRMNLLAAATQVWAEPTMLQYLKPSDFSPPPKVESAIVALATRVLPLATSEKLNAYYSFIKKLFKQPRKTTLNNLVDGYELLKEKVNEILAKEGIDATSRPQNLNLETLLQLSAGFPLPRE